MLQRIVKPAFFGLLFIVVLGLTLSSGRGDSLTDPFMMGRYADFAAQSPLLATLLLLVAIPVALIFLLLPESTAVTTMVSATGFWPGSLLSIVLLLVASGLCCSLTSALLHPSVRRWIAARRRLRGKGGQLLTGRSVLPVEICLLVSSVLLLLPLPAVLVGCLLGLVGMRTKAFCLAAFPFLFVRCVMTGLATTEASWFTLLLLGLLGTLFLAFLVYWLALILRRRLHQEAMAGPVQLVAPQVRRKENRGLETIQIEPIETGSPAPENRAASLSLGSVLVVCVSEGDAACTDLVVGEANAIGARVVTCTLAPDSEAPRLPIRDGFENHPSVADLDELFVRAFNEGADLVIAVRTISPLVRRDTLAEVRDLLPKSRLVLGPCQDGFHLVALQRPTGALRYEQGLLANRDFRSEIAFGLAGLAPHPHLLPLLPQGKNMRPMVSVIVLAQKDGSTTLAATIRAALHEPWTECLVAQKDDLAANAAEAAGAGAEIVSLPEAEPSALLTAAARKARADILIFVRDGVCLPTNFDEAAWRALGQERCRIGGFSLPQDLSSLERGMRWLGTALKPGSLSGPGLEQGLFVRREDFLLFGGFDSEDLTEAARSLVARAARVGRVVLHNARVSFLAPQIEDGGEDGTGSTSVTGKARSWLAGAAKDRLGKLGRKHDGERADDGTDRHMEAALALVESCDHCGRCTEVSPMLHKYRMDLADLPRHPLLAWHCFLCGACTKVCPKGIDALALVRQLRASHVLRHGNRMARPGHGKTLSLAKVPVYDRSMLPGANLLLDADFCCAYPQTAQELARRVWQAGLGVIVADCGARLADLGMEKASRSQLDKLRAAMEKGLVTSLYTVSPISHRFLVAMGITAEPVYDLLRTMDRDCRHVAMERFRLLLPCQDNSSEVYARALAPFLDGQVQPLEVPCCGAGGEANVLEPTIAADLKKAIRAGLKGGLRVITYCTESALTLERSDIATDHALALLLGTGESAHSGLSQMKALGQTLLVVARLGRKATQEGAARQVSAAADEKAQAAPEEGLVARTLGRLGIGTTVREQDAGMPELDFRETDRASDSKAGTGPRAVSLADLRPAEDAPAEAPEAPVTGDGEATGPAEDAPAEAPAKAPEMPGDGDGEASGPAESAVAETPAKAAEMPGAGDGEDSGPADGAAVEGPAKAAEMPGAGDGEDSGSEDGAAVEGPAKAAEMPGAGDGEDSGSEDGDTPARTAAIGMPAADRQAGEPGTGADLPEEAPEHGPAHDWEEAPARPAAQAREEAPADPGEDERSRLRSDTPADATPSAESGDGPEAGSPDADRRGPDAAKAGPDDDTDTDEARARHGSAVSLSQYCNTDKA